jgi:phenylpropionate dioxygenase-like ring-hydroxylating dioxygenase large terminal subunit
MRYLRNAWYVAALSGELQSGPISRELLGERMVIFRTESGQTAIIADRCSHRFAPLSLGRVDGESIECRYHGLRFGVSGNCILNPHGDKRIPLRADVPSWPTHERHGFIWFWPGDPAKADDTLIPLYPFNEDPSHFAVVYGYIHVAAHYELVVDNLLDLSHVEFLHPQFKQAGGVDAHKTSYSVEGTTVVANRLKPNVEIQGLARLFWTSQSKRFDARANMRWMPPSALLFDLGGTECGAPLEEGVCLPNAHLITPASDFHCHYFWSIARNRQINNEEAGRNLHQVAQKIFITEDIWMIEAQQRNIESVTNILSLRPVTLEPDTPAVWARRILANLIRREAGEGAAVE